MDKFDLSRFKNYALWVSVAALIPLLLNAFGVKFIPEEYEAIVNSILAILVAAGIINNPTTEAKWFGDDKAINIDREKEALDEKKVELVSEGDTKDK